MDASRRNASLFVWACSEYEMTPAGSTDATTIKLPRLSTLIFELSVKVAMTLSLFCRRMTVGRGLQFAISSVRGGCLCRV